MLPAEEYRARARARFVAATIRQQKTLEDLLANFFFDRVQRNGYLSRECQREIKYLDEVSKQEAQRLIAELIDRRNSSKQGPRDDRDPEDEE